MGSKNYHSSWTVRYSVLLLVRLLKAGTFVSYVLSVLLKKVFMFKCNLAMLRITPLLSLLLLPLVLTRLICFHQRERPPQSLVLPTTEAVILSSFPIAWFFGFLYYTETPSLLFVVATVVAATERRHWLAALVCCLISGLHVMEHQLMEDKDGS